MDAINWHSLFFLLFGLFAGVFALAVVFTSNVVRMAFFLVISLGATAGLFFLAGADFVGAMQLMIYVGGTLVLLVFGVMLTAQSPFISLKTRGGEWVLAAIVGGSLLALLIPTALSVEAWRAPNAQAQRDVIDRADPTAARLGLGLLGIRSDRDAAAVDADADSSNNAPSDGKAGYLLPFEIVSVHLLVVLIGAAYLARTKKRRE